MNEYRRATDKKTGAAAGASSGLRRFLAVLCAACLVFLQCFMILPALEEHAHAAGGLPVNGSTAEGYDGSGTYSGDGGSVKEILNEFDLTVSKVDNVGCNVGELSMSDQIEKKDGSYYLVMGEDPETGEPILSDDAISSIDFVMSGSYTPVKKITLHKIEDMKAGKSKTLKYGSDYKASGDDFFKKHFAAFLEPSVSGDAGQEIGEKYIKFTAGSVGSTIKVSIKERTTGKPSTSRSCNVVSKKLTASPSSLTINVGSSSPVIVKDDSGTLNSSQLKWKSSNSKVATVSSGMIRGVKGGTATITITSTAPTSKGLKTTVKVTVKEITTTSYTPTRSSYTGYRPTTRSGGSVLGTTTGTGATTTTTATRPTETAATLAPSFQTIKVKQVYLTPASTTEDDTVYYDENGNPIEDEGPDDSTEEDWDEDGVTFPAAAGSAAVAVAACGVGAVGRVRRFHFDMSDAALGAVVKAAGKGGKGKLPGGKKSGSADADAAAKAAAGAKGAGSQTAAGQTADADKKDSKNPLRKFRRKS